MALRRYGELMWSGKEALIELMYAAEQWRKTDRRPKPPWDKLSVACFQAGQLGDKSIAVHSMKQALTLSSNVARAD
jgi:hypothetical protein